ncbi:SUMF1/EgtB/PvdO family nonheme iron enzyme [Chryseolinea lacunae]|uniref:SUMF1/EgtB/PvdO family nonheme iron enzyme n=1 Tax=Chryseolinea lacunae TaxID=2801331 RepID=A0ABS1L2B2_9BACT|nr:SUMF1/EgtB/PvdO family nonheme iron enzyme [Chryseolinea lacunae]MBL0745673.1 SUMF1/EgtB/PvdO family nonheme iron enzyme [Chryseolinea lacunae]
MTVVGRIIALGLFAFASAFGPLLAQTALPTPAPFNPIDGATKVDLWASLVWSFPYETDISGYTFDLYFGTTPTPPLFRADVYDGWSHPDGSEGVYKVADDPLVMMEFLSFVPLINPETTYYWKVAVKDGSGHVAEGPVASFTSARENPLPSEPTLLSPSNKASDVSRNITLTWKKSVDPDGDAVFYQLFFGTNALNTSYQPLLADNLTTTSYSFSNNLSDQQTYYWKVVAVDKYSGTLVSHDGTNETWSFTVENYVNDAPGAPALVAPTQAAQNIGNNVLLAWSASTDKDDDVVTYDLYLDKTPAPSTLLAHNLDRTRHSVRLDDAGTYYWKIVAKDVQGASTSSDVFSFTTWTTPPPFSYELVPVEGGTFTMGQSDTDKVLFGYHVATGAPIYMDATMEQPAHNVSVPNFAIGKYLVTNAQFVTFLNAVKHMITLGDSWTFSAHPRKGFYYTDAFLKDESTEAGQSIPIGQIYDATRTDRAVGYEKYYDSPIIWNGQSFSVDPGFENHPVRFVYFEAARHFAQWLGMDLPTEAEWEYAAMGGKFSHGYTFSGSNTLTDVMADKVPEIFPGQSTQPVGTKMANELGIYDMSGNVGEVCFDFYDRDFYKRTTGPGLPIGSTYLLRMGHTVRGLASHVSGRVKARSYDANDSYAELAGIRLIKRSTRIFSVSGYVRGKSGRIGDVTFDGLPFELRTEQFGSYFTGLPEGWSGTITPRARGYIFSPASITINNLQADQQFDFTGTLSSSYTVAGKITDAAGKPIAGVAIQGALSPTVTDENGDYTFQTYTGWSGTLTPLLTGYNFSPAARTVVNQTSDIKLQDFSASFSGVFLLSGKIADQNGDALAAVLLKGFPQEVTTDGDGNYQTSVTGGWSGSVVPDLAGYVFAPAQREVTSVNADITHLDFSGAYVGNYLISGIVTNNEGEPLPGVSISNGSQSVVTNAAGQYVFTVPPDWTGTLTPGLQGYFFEPDHISLSAIRNSIGHQDFTAQEIPLANEEDVASAVTIYPNPTSGSFFVKSRYTNAHYSVMSGLGKPVPIQVRTFEGYVQVTMDNISPGVYVLTIETLTATLSKKIVLTQ